MAAALRTLDVSLSQVLIDFFDDPNFSWHHRLLVVELGTAKWASVTPDLQVETVDLTAHRVLPLRRNAPFPARALNDMYIFDPVDDATLAELQRECLALARVLGVTGATVAAGVVAGDWRIADPARSDFGDKVEDADMAAPDTAVVRDNAGLLQKVSQDGAREWVPVERILPTKFEDWKDLKQSGPGRDLRIASNWRDSAGHRHSSLAASLNVYRDTKFADWPFRGPKAVSELLRGVQKSGQELSTYDLFWSSRSGIVKQPAVAITHRNIFAVLHLLQSYDQIDLLNMAGADYLARWALMIQAATKKSPKAPVFAGLDHFLSHSFDECGGVVTSDFSKFIADEQKSEAMVMKQHRLWHEEQLADDKTRNRDKEKDKPKGGGGPKAAAAEA